MNHGRINWRANPRTLRTFGLTGLLVFGLIGAWIGWRHTLLFATFTEEAASSIAITLWSVAALMGALAAIAPRLLRPAYVGMALVAMPVGIVVSHTVLLLLYFGVLTPVGLLMRALGRDPLGGTGRVRSDSCWQERTQTKSPKRYYQQY